MYGDNNSTTHFPKPPLSLRVRSLRHVLGKNRARNSSWGACYLITRMIHTVNWSGTRCLNGPIFCAGPRRGFAFRRVNPVPQCRLSPRHNRLTSFVVPASLVGLRACISRGLLLSCFCSPKPKYISMCPDGAEGTTYAILTTMTNVSQAAAFNLGTHFTSFWDVSNESFL